MIITLKGADFSASNIGTLSSWRISRSLGAGATYEGVTSVDKGAAFSATVIIAEGYELGTAGVTVTMGGTVLSGAHSISGNVITITIAEVTGNVLIKVPTINTAGGDEPEEPEEPDLVWILGSTDSDKVEFGTSETRMTAYAKYGTREMITVTEDNASTINTDYRGTLYLAEIPDGTTSLNVPAYQNGEVLFSLTLYNNNFSKIHNTGYGQSQNVILSNYPDAMYYSLNCKHNDNTQDSLILCADDIKANYKNICL